MHRSFKIALPNDTLARNVYDTIIGKAPGLNGVGLLPAITGAIPTDGILPDRCCYMKLTADTGNAANTLSIDDRNNANTSGRPVTGGDVYEVGPMIKNSVCIRDYIIVPGVGNLTYEVNFEYL